MSAHRLFSNAQRYEQNGEIYQNVALRSARAIVLCVQVGDIFYTDNGAAPQDRPLFLIQCGTVFCTKAGFFDASKYIDTHIVSNGYLFYPVILTDPDPDFQDGPATYKVLGPHSSVAQADIGSADSAGATARRRWFPLVSVWWPMTVQQRIAHAITDHYRELGYPLDGPYDDRPIGKAGSLTTEVRLWVRTRTLCTRLASDWTTFEMAYLVFYPAHLTFIPIAYADSGSRRRRRYYEYAKPRMFRRLDRLFRELYGIQR